MKIAFYTLGCKVNRYETEVLINQFSAEGFSIVNHDEPLDVFVINSCTVTSSGDKKTLQIIRRIKRSNPTAIICLTGCFPQAFPEKASAVLEADVVQGAYNRKGLLKNVKRALETGERIVDIVAHKTGEQFEPMQTDHFSQRTRAFLKIEDGCDRYCTYCIIPKARGPIRSKQLIDIHTEVLGLVKNGYKEIVLVGINLSSYGKDLAGTRLIEAVELVASIEGVARVRLGSLEPELMLEDDLERLSKIDKFCPQFHLSLQSGCDLTLNRMNRHYTSDEYYGIVNMVRVKFDNPAITTDIMVGFAGETEEEFKASLDFSKKLKLAKAHVFIYSIREGTKAAAFDNQVDNHTKEQRSKRMIEAQRIEQQKFLATQVGRESEVLFETELGGDRFVGYTKNYTRVVAHYHKNLCGRVQSVKLISVEQDYCIAEIIED